MIYVLRLFRFFVGIIEAWMFCDFDYKSCVIVICFFTPFWFYVHFVIVYVVLHWFCLDLVVF